MAYERYEGRDEPSGRDWRERERFEGRDRDRFRGRFGEGDERDERGFFERAGDEISSWFGDEEAERRRQSDQMMREREFGRGPAGGYGRDEQRNYPRGRHPRDEEHSHRPMGWTASDSDYRFGYDRDVEPREYGAVGGYYGSRTSARSGDFRDYDRGSEWDRDDYRRTSFAGSSARSQRDDPHYEEWKRRQMDELDRDYHEFRREHQSRFDEDFTGWRQRRQQKRGLLGSIREHMEVVGSDGEHVGTVDRVAGDRVILTRSDPQSGGAHHSISCTMVDRIDGDRVVLDTKAETARQRWRDESRERALFEREDQGRAGPGILNRSFSGTYR